MATQTQTTVNDLPSWQKPYVKYGFGQLQNWYKSNTPKYYQGTTVAGFSPDQESAFSKVRSMANTDYTADPYSSQVFQGIQSKVMPAVNSQFSASGRYGSGAHASQMTRALTDAYAPYASQQYQKGIENNMNAANALTQTGQMQRDFGQQQIDDAVARWNFQQNLPFNKIMSYMGPISGNFGGSTIQTGPAPKTQGDSMFGNILGLGATALGLLG